METAGIPQGVAPDIQDLDPGIAALLDRKKERIAHVGTYVPLTVQDTQSLLVRFFATERPGARVDGVARVGGGASKEQFVFTLEQDGETTRHILRMDPIQTASETDRRREFEALNVFHKVVPAPGPEYLDHDGTHFGQPAAITNFINGVTKPTNPDGGPNVTGIGTVFTKGLREQLATQHLSHLAAIHNYEWTSDELPSFHEPSADPFQPARWAINWWSRVWRDDAVQVLPIAALTERWLRRNLPTLHSRPVVVHGDFRTGNFLYDEGSATITAVLDWEYAHLGDFHEDLGWMVQGLYTTYEDGQALVSGLHPIESFVEEYTRLSGREVNRRTLHWYTVLNAYKSLAITLATSTKAARDGHNHQDAMLSWMAPVGYRFASDLCELLTKETTA